MSYVSSRFLADFLHALDLKKIDVDELVGDLPVDWLVTGSHTRLIEWGVFCELMVRLERMVGSREALEHLGDSIADMRTAPILRRLAGLAASPMALYDATQRWALGRAAPGVRIEMERIGESRLKVVATIAEHDRDCPQVFHVATGAARALTHILDLPSAVVSAKVAVRRAEYDILLPPSGTLIARARRAARAFFSARAALSEMELQQMELQLHFDELHRSYSELQASEARQRALTDSLVDTMAELSPDGRFIFVTPSIEALTGYRTEQVIGSHLTLWLQREDVEAGKQLLREILHRGRTPDRGQVLRVCREDGRTVWIEITARTFTNMDGELHTVAILRDVSGRVSEAGELTLQQTLLEDMVAQRTHQLERRNRDLRELQALLLEAERAGAVRDLAGHLAYSINNPLGALICSLELAASDDETDPHALDQMVQLAHRMAEVVNRTLDLYRDGKVDRMPLAAPDLMEALKADLAPRAAHYGVELHCRVDPALTEFDADRSLLLSGLLSIAENALDAMRDGGEIGIEMSLVCEADAQDIVRVEIWDTGPGIPVSEREQMLHSLVTAHSGGAGLGLAIASSVIAGHEGQIRVDDREGGGSLITVEIPRH